MSTAHTAYTAAGPTSLADPRSSFSLALRLYSGYQQVADFRMPGVAVLGLDECPPLGHGWGPSPVHLLGSSLGGCLGGALLHQLREAGVEVLDLRTEVSGTVRTDTLGRSHVARITVRLTPVVDSRSALEAIPTPERLAERSMIADALRPDLGLWVAITPEVRGELRPVRAVARGGATLHDTAASVPHFVEVASA